MPILYKECFIFYHEFMIQNIIEFGGSGQARTVEAQRLSTGAGSIERCCISILISR